MSADLPGATALRPAGVPIGFREVAHADPSRVAIIEPDRAPITFGDLRDRVDQLSHALDTWGVGAGEVVCSVLSNRREYHELRLATGQTGRYLTPMSHHLSAVEIAHIVADTGTRVVVTEPHLVPVVDDALASLPGASGESGEFGRAAPPIRVITVGEEYERELGAHPASAPDVLRAGDYLGYTSGTTGRPKGVRKPLSDNPPAVGDLQLGYLARLGIRPGREVHLVVAPLYHSAPGTLSDVALKFGHTVVISERPTPQEILALIERHRVSITFTVPTVLGRWLRLPRETRDRYDLTSLRSIVHAGAPCPVEVKRGVIEWLDPIVGPVLHEFYGATEGSATCVSTPEWLQRPGTVGLPIPGSRVAILDEAGTELPPGEIGQVWYRPTVTVEYLGAEEKTAAATRGDLFTTGDLGRLDEDGFLFLADRRTDLILTGGVNVYPAEVEAALAEHPQVADAAVIGAPDDDWGQRVVALIQPESGASSATLLESLPGHLRARLAGYKVPREIHVVDHLPRTHAGKMMRREVRDIYRDALARRAESERP
ncbi:AMP-binding protein [Kribbia dieselivorans]|uniref:AMP-binding protein n=1 Tax=Kribbia dieselivorans TaxID=331526 RepID=UPI00083992D5|nr:AMP-binding protein [Kribbia dieselivorans]